MKKMFSFIAILLVGGGLGYGLTKLMLDDRPPGAEPLIPAGYGGWLLALLPVMYLIVVGIHELGHVIAGRKQNFSFYGLTVGPLAWKPDDQGRVRFSWNKNLNLAGGVAIMLPVGAEQLRRRFMWFAAGGPLASLVLTLAAWLLSLALPDRSFVGLVLVVVALFSLVIFVATIIPSRAGGFSSDGMRIITFARGGATAEADLIGLSALAHLRAGQPYQDFPLEQMARLAASPEVPEQQRVSIDYYRYLAALAKEDLATAGELLNSVMDRLEVYPGGTHGAFYLEQALFEAKYRNDVVAAEAALGKYTESPFTEAHTLPLVKAAIAAASDDAATLAQQIALAEPHLSKSMDQSRVPIIREWIAEWRSEISTS